MCNCGFEEMTSAVKLVIVPTSEGMQTEIYRKFVKRLEGSTRVK
jgi:hypothetical protein